MVAPMRSRPLTLLVAAAAVFMLGCGSEDSPISDLRPGGTGAPSVSVAPGDANDEAAAPVATPAPAPEQPEPEQPAPGPVETVAPSPAEPAEDDSSLLPILFGIVLLVLAAVMVGAVVSRRSSPAEPPPAATPPIPTPQVTLLTNAQWIHDHLTLELLAAAPGDALQRWTNERRRLDDVAIGAQQQFVSGGPEAWSSLSQTMTALSSALDTNLRLRAQVPPDPTLIQESTAVVNRQRATLIQLVAALWPTATATSPQR